MPLSFGGELLQNNAAAPPRIILIDISDWKSDEIKFSKQHGVQCLNPREIGLKRLDVQLQMQKYHHN